MRERSRSPRAPRRRRRVGLVTVVLLIVGGWFVLLSILGRRLQRGRQQRLGAEVDAAAPAPSCRPTLPPAPEQPAHPVARYTEHTNAVKTWAFHHNRLSKGRSKDLPPEKLHFNHFWGARTFGWGDAIPDELLAKTDEYRVAAELAEAVRAWTAVRRRRLGSEAVQPPPASFLSS